MFCISVVWKLSVDIRAEESGLKGVYGFKFVYLAEDQKYFFTQWSANGKWYNFCAHENSDVYNDYCTSFFGKYSYDGNA